MKWAGKIGRIILFLLCLTLTGCGSESRDSADSEEKITITMMHYWGDYDNDSSAQNLNKILEDEFPEAFPNVELVQETCDNETYKQKIKIALASGEEPDLMFSYSEGFMEEFVKNGKLLALDDYLDDSYKEKMIEDRQSGFVFDGQRYGIGITSWKGVLYCNKALFEQAGVEIPTTYDELLSACQALREADIEPIAIGMTNKWQGTAWINNFTLQLGGSEHYKALANGSVTRNDPVLAEAAGLVMDLISDQAFYSEMYKINSDQAENLFLDGDAAMIYMGSWFTSRAENSLGDDLAVATMPVIDGAAYTDVYHGGTANGWVVSAKTQYPELVTDIAAWLADRLSAYEPENATFYISEDEQMNAISPAAQDILDLYQDKRAGGVNWDTAMNSGDAAIWLDTVADFWKKGQSGEAFAQTLEEKMTE